MSWLSLVRRFLLFTFAFSWGAWFLAGWSRRDAVYLHWGTWEFQLPLYPSFVLAGLLGPGLAALWLAGDREDANSLWARLKNWRVNPSWYSIAMFLPPSVIWAAAFILCRLGGLRAPTLTSQP